MADNTIPNQPEKEPRLIEDIFAAEKAAEVVRPAAPETRPEQHVEQAPETRPEQASRTIAEDESSRRGPAPIQPQHDVQPPSVKSPDLVKIESILSENLDDLFLQMTPEQQMAFRQKGEETANKIELLMREVKVRVKEVLSAIRDWLRMLPGINKFFLEQEAKIKTDRLLAMHEQKNERSRNKS